MLLFDVAFHTVLAIPTLTTWRQLQLHSRKSHSNGGSVVLRICTCSGCLFQWGNINTTVSWALDMCCAVAVFME